MQITKLRDERGDSTTKRKKNGYKEILKKIVCQQMK